MRAAPAVWIRRSVVLANALALVVGLVLVVVAAFLSKQQVPATVLSLIGGAFVSAAVVTLVLGALAVRETVDAYQNLRISYRVDVIPSSLRLVCAASRDDRALEEFRAENFVLRWLVDDDLDPGDPMVFRVGGIRVDNEALRSRTSRSIGVIGGKAVVLSYDVPRRLRQTAGHSVEFRVLVRKFVGAETRLRIQAQLFRGVTDAEYRLSVDPGLHVTRLWPSATEVSAIGVARGGSMESTYPPPFDSHAAIVKLPFPLQPGSTVAFLVDRKPAG